MRSLQFVTPSLLPRSLFLRVKATANSRYYICTARNVAPTRPACVTFMRTMFLAFVSIRTETLSVSEGFLNLCLLIKREPQCLLFGPFLVAFLF